ncbi:MAG: HAMP domain-containing histidine kinase [Planctomycetes bacterium]|nr:HAMP domain-containing histidine kinase [Planctomycetota bacterium]
MRWPLRNQIMVPMIGVMLPALVGVSALNAYLSGHKVKQQIERQLQGVTSTLSESNFPLTSGVLQQMRGLTGAEFVLADESGQLLASIAEAGALSFANSAFLQTQPQQAEKLTLGKPIHVGGQWYFHAAVQLQRHNALEQTVQLHILYPEQSYREVWRQAVYPPLVIGAGALLLVVLFAGVIASRIVRPMLRLQSQVGRIAEGDFRRIELPSRDDEVRDLSVSVSRMAGLLSRYEDEVRHSERLRTLGQLGSGIAHQLRNSATGCRLAIELHQRECSPGSNCECLDVADRQITLMEKQLKRFLSLGKPSTRPSEAVDFATLIENTLPLLHPYARHVGVTLQWSPPTEPSTVIGESDALEQLLLNLLMNAIEAASRCDEDSLPHIGQRRVTVQLEQEELVRVSLEVTDSGPGPSCSVQEELFEPFVTDKPDGTGLGLSVAREIAEQHGGEIRWRRRDSATCFTVDLPLQKKPLISVETQSVEVTRS